jgi:hypothetical protein
VLEVRRRKTLEEIVANEKLLAEEPHKQEEKRTQKKGRLKSAVVLVVSAGKE